MKPSEQHLETLYLKSSKFMLSFLKVLIHVLPPAPLEALRSQRKAFLSFLLRGQKRQTPCASSKSRFLFKLLPEEHNGFSLPASQRQRKKIDSLCVLCGSAVNDLILGILRIETESR